VTYRLAEEPPLWVAAAAVGVALLILLAVRWIVFLARWIREDADGPDAARTAPFLPTVGVALAALIAVATVIWPNAFLGALILGHLQTINEARLLDSGCVRFSSYVRSTDVCPDEVYEVVRDLATEDDRAYRNPPTWAMADDFGQPPPASVWRLKGFEIRLASSSLAVHGPDAAALAAWYAQQNSSIRVATTRELEQRGL
jgi:hypothetical protein